MYDIIGDIHGHAQELVQLLTKLDYTLRNGCYRHKNRRVIFCGDFIDRGPQIPRVVEIARDMVEAGSALAVMGNHEFNALAYHTEDPNSPGSFLRSHTPQNIRQHAKTVDQFQPDDLQQALNWFRTLPPALDVGPFRVVHACWHPDQIALIEQAILDYGRFTPEFLQRATDRNDPLFEAIECVMKGPELPLPDGVTVADKEGFVRRRIRIRWFDQLNGRTWSNCAFPHNPDLPDLAISDETPAVPYPTDAVPVFFGHYWLSDNVPSPVKPNVACLDYSVAKHGRLCAYRFDGQSTLNEGNFVWVDSFECESQP